VITIFGTYFFRCFFIALMWQFKTAHPVDIEYSPNYETQRTHNLVLNFSQKNRNPFFDVRLPLDLSEYEYFACNSDWENPIGEGPQ